MPRSAAALELVEETGLRGELLPVPAAVSVRAYRARRWACRTPPSSVVRCRSAGSVANHRRGSILRRSGRAPFPRTAAASARMCVGWRPGTGSGRTEPCR
ncbi:hypothetical protein [Streptosporangium sp. NBC_01495]|uniref:hypothetical protein n=1 Tax=Streptosporangium sp. NBC_01495 TaxID=2903899 RepID=UPI003FCCBAD6